MLLLEQGMGQQGATEYSSSDDEGGGGG